MLIKARKYWWLGLLLVPIVAGADQSVEMRVQGYSMVMAPAIEDTTLFGMYDNDTNLGASRYLYLGWEPNECCNPGGSGRTVLLRFDISELPSDEIVRYAELRLDQVGNVGWGEMNTNTRLFYGDWDEDTFTGAWMREQEEVLNYWPWYSYGVANMVAAPRQAGTVAWDVTEHVEAAQEYADQTGGTADFAIWRDYQPDTYPDDSLFVFASKEGAGKDLHAPVLLIWYGEPHPWWAGLFSWMFDDEDEVGEAELQLMRFESPVDVQPPIKIIPATVQDTSILENPAVETELESSAIKVKLEVDASPTPTPSSGDNTGLPKVTPTPSSEDNTSSLKVTPTPSTIPIIYLPIASPSPSSKATTSTYKE